MDRLLIVLQRLRCSHTVFMSSQVGVETVPTKAEA